MRSNAWSALGAALAVICGAWFARGSEAFALDDAYIHLAYAKSLWLGEGLSYNPNDWEVGATSPLWAVLLAPLANGAHVVPAVQALGIALHALSAYVAGQLAYELCEQELGAGIAAALVALHPLLLEGAVSGMEVPLATLCFASVTLLCVRGQYRAGALASACAVFARPEALCFVGLLALGRGWQLRSWRPFWLLAGAALAMGLWELQCVRVSGYPLPNTFYAKSGFEPLASLHYLGLRVLLVEPWLPSAWLFLRGLRQHRWLAASYLITLLAIALGRTLQIDVLFYQQRYFACVAFLPCVLVARRSWWAVPAFVASLMLMPRSLAHTHAQEHSTKTLHVDVARYVNAHLPHDARLAVEGAGALRYFTARELEVIDIMGLNAHDVIHAGSWAKGICRVAERAPTHLALPPSLVEPLSKLFTGELLAEFKEPAFAHIATPIPWSVRLIRVTGLREPGRSACRQLAALP